VRVSVFGSDMGNVRGGAATVGRSATIAPRSACPVQAPPSANAVAGTVDLLFRARQSRPRLRVGQRVAVDLPLAGQADGLSVPSRRSSATSMAANGSTRRPRQHLRASADRGRSVTDDRALLSRGLSAVPKS
jgi:hypothetical protein